MSLLAPASPYGPRLERWEKRTELPLIILSVIFLLTYGWEVIWNLKHPADLIPDAIINIVWVAFIVDYLARLYLTMHRGLWFRKHILDLLLVGLPFFRPLRLLRLAQLATRLHTKAAASFHGRVITYVISSATLLVLLGSLGVLDAEQNAPGSNIRSFGNALWWAVVTITTIGYGDYYPVTLQGRLVAVGLMISGIALIGSVTATFASWFLEQVKSESDKRDEDAE